MLLIHLTMMNNIVPQPLLDIVPAQYGRMQVPASRNTVSENLDFALRERSSSSEHQYFQPSIAREPPQQSFHPSSFAMHNHLSGKTDSHGDYTGIVNHWVAYLVADG
jgi:hypothetical protein